MYFPYLGLIAEITVAIMNPINVMPKHVDARSKEVKVVPGVFSTLTLRWINSMGSDNPKTCSTQTGQSHIRVPVTKASSY